MMNSCLMKRRIAMKTQEELYALKEEVENVSKKLSELTDEELEQVTGGSASAIAVGVALQGRVGGVQLGSDNGQPGEGAQIRVRGGKSFTGSNDPLIIIDGFAKDN